MTATPTNQQYFYGLGRRKTSIARVRLFPGEGNVTVNGKPSRDYFGREVLDIIVQQPLRAVDTGANFNVIADVEGGGSAGQAGAVRLGIARALLKADEANRSAPKASSPATPAPKSARSPA